MFPGLGKHLSECRMSNKDVVSKGGNVTNLHVGLQGSPMSMWKTQNIMPRSSATAAADMERGTKEVFQGGLPAGGGATERNENTSMAASFNATRQDGPQQGHPFPQRAWSAAAQLSQDLPSNGLALDEGSRAQWSFGRNLSFQSPNVSGGPYAAPSRSNSTNSGRRQQGIFAVDDLLQASLDIRSNSSPAFMNGGDVGGEREVASFVAQQQQQSDLRVPYAKITRSVTAHKSIAELNALMNPNMYPNGKLPASALNLIPLLNAATAAKSGMGFASSRQQASHVAAAAAMVTRSQSEKISSSMGQRSASHNGSAFEGVSSVDSLPSPGRSGNSSNTLRCSSNPQASMHSLYKTELCRSWEETGCCRYGNKCQFAHGKSELRPIARHPKYKTEICRTFATSGTCPYGTRCRFIHYISKDAMGGAPSGGVRSSTESSGEVMATGESIQSSTADTWTELLDLYNETKCLNDNSVAAAGGKVKRTKSAYPRLEQAETPLSPGGNQGSKRLPIFQSLSFEERHPPTSASR